MHAHVLNILLVVLICLKQIYACEYTVTISSNGPIVRGATIQFKAAVFCDGRPTDEKLKYIWGDNAIKPHTREVESQNNTDIWNVTYETVDNNNPFGDYDVQVIVQNCWFGFDILCPKYKTVASARYNFDVTETLNGNLNLVQHNKVRNNNFVANDTPVFYNISIKETDWNFIKTAPKISTFWFVDCVYYGFFENLTFSANYSKVDEQHTVEALVVADFTPLPPTTTVPPSTTTQKPKTTTTLPTTTSTKPSTTKKPTNETVTSRPVKRNVNESPAKNTTSNIKIYKNGTLVPYNGDFPWICNSTKVATDPKMAYGYFSNKFTVKSPMKVNITGNNWLQHGDLLSLNVQCHGSKPMQYCVKYRKGALNVTGNETCDEYFPLESCPFPIQRYLAESMKHTIFVIIKNDVSEVVSSSIITIYQAKVQAQLSVVVVPVAFSLVAVVIVVFGVAYYFQNQSRFVVEVADFNFGHQYTDMEYKTFKERLRDSVVNAFTRAPSPDSSEVPVWPPGRKYGSMT